ncbi:MAG: riboflavin synthase [Candidatus Freyarchaeum deiterrae]
MAKVNVGVTDTTFARYDMAKVAIEEMEDNSSKVNIIRYTVPGVKDLPVASKKLIEEYGCEIVMAIGMPGAEPIDKLCAHEAALGIIDAQILTNKHVIECFVYEDEAETPEELASVCEDRARKHARNVLRLLFDKEWLTKNAGQGLRQGRQDVGPLKP